MLGRAGAGLSIVGTLASWAICRAKETVSRGISSWQIRTEAERIKGTRSSSWSAVKEEFASSDDNIILF